MITILKQLDYGLRLAEVQILGDDSRDQINETFDKLGKIDTPLRDPRIAIALARAYQRSGDHQSQLRAATSALADANKFPNGELFQANASLSLCWAYRDLNKLKEASDACNAAYMAFDKSNDSVAKAVVLNGNATINSDWGLYDRALDDYKKVLEITRKNNALTDYAGALVNTARTLIFMGNLDVAALCLRGLIPNIPPTKGFVNKEQCFNQTFPAGTPAGIIDPNDKAIAFVLYSEILFDQGNVSGARASATARQIARNEHYSSTEAYALYNQGLCQMEMGRLAEARSDFKNHSEYETRLRRNQTIGSYSEVSGTHGCVKARLTTRPKAIKMHYHWWARTSPALCRC